MADGPPDSQGTGGFGQFAFSELHAGPPGFPACYSIEVERADLGHCPVALTPVQRSAALDADQPVAEGVDFDFTEIANAFLPLAPRDPGP